MNSFEVNGDGIDSDNLSEMAKSFHTREFGNGNANGSNSGTHKDFSMNTTGQQTLAFTMDDGSTSATGFETNTPSASQAVSASTAGHFVYFTFFCILVKF